MKSLRWILPASALGLVAVLAAGSAQAAEPGSPELPDGGGGGIGGALVISAFFVGSALLWDFQRRKGLFRRRRR